MSKPLRRVALAAALVAASLVAAQVQAAPLIDTGTPTGGLSMANVVDASNWLAERFTLTSDAVIDQINAFVLSVDAADVGKSFTVAVYGNAGNNLPALNFNAPAQGQLFQTSVIYNADGWNASATGLNWSLSAGTYWFAVESDANGPGSMLLPTGTATKAEALAAYSGSNAYASAGLAAADTFGLQVTPVPEPEGWLLSVAGLGFFALRRRTKREPFGRGPELHSVSALRATIPLARQAAPAWMLEG